MFYAGRSMMCVVICWKAGFLNVKTVKLKRHIPLPFTVRVNDYSILKFVF